MTNYEITVEVQEEAGYSSAMLGLPFKKEAD